MTAHFHDQMLEVALAEKGEKSPAYRLHIHEKKAPRFRLEKDVPAVQIAEAKPQYIPQILSALGSADLSRYKDSMRPLIERDLRETEEKLTRFLREGQ